jgi:hypothetical protein
MRLEHLFGDSPQGVGATYLKPALAGREESRVIRLRQVSTPQGEGWEYLDVSPPFPLVCTTRKRGEKKYGDFLISFFKKGINIGRYWKLRKS